MSRLFDVDVVAVLSGRDVSDLMEKKSIQCDYIISTVDLPRLPVEGDFSAADALRAMQGHVLAEAALHGTYTLNPALG